MRTHTEYLELDQDRLFELGATGIEELEESQNSDSGKIVLKAFFEIEQTFQSALVEFASTSELSSGQEKIEDWDRSWRDRQTPVEVTPNLFVVPPWVPFEANGKHVIRLEAKMAFGTGSHETTRIAALLLEKLSLKGCSVLDIGTGTGLLALYAAQIGAEQVLALDIDPVAGPCLIENIALNPLAAGSKFRTLIGETSALAPGARFDLVLCNMIRSELWPFREELRTRLNPRGHFIVSGQRVEDKAAFLAWKELSPFQILSELEMEGWWGFCASLV